MAVIDIKCYDCGKEVCEILLTEKSFIQNGNDFEDVLVCFLNKRIVLCEDCMTKMERL